MKRIALVVLVLFSFQNIFAQKFTKRDSLQGGLRLERTSFDVQRYDLNIQLNPTDRTIVGYNEISFIVVNATKKIQIDLFENMKVDSIIWNNEKLIYTREFDAVFVDFPSELAITSSQKIRFYYSGKPKIAKNAPWDGGFVFSNDVSGKPFVGVAVQGIGASLWFPVKDSQTDEPDKGATIKVAVPNGLMNVSNGRFKGSEDLKNGYTRWDWEVVSPINTYSITVNIADYVHIEDKLDNLDLDYYVLRENEAKARKHFDADVKPMMKCFQEKFGQYPFLEDGYKLVEAPFLGMEHQSAVAYGNKYRKGYLGQDLSGSGEGLFFDYIIIHETGHEWFGNSITSKDIADMWIHESFTTYSESVFIECMKGYEVAMKYINGQAFNVRNDKKIIGQFGVNNEGGGDMYYKGALLLNTIRHVINDDGRWWKILRDYSEFNKNKIIETQDVINFFNKASSKDLTSIFNQYLNYTAIPELEIKGYLNRFQYRWKTDVANFNMPIEITIKGVKSKIKPTNEWQKYPYQINSMNDIKVDKTKYYIKCDL